MRLNHIGLNIASVSEVQDFYQEILGLFSERDFAINQQIAQAFFGIDSETHAFIVRNEDLTLELFVYGKPISLGYAHLCVEVPDREKAVRKCVVKGYQVMRMKRENDDLLFVKDKAGNVFELKNIQYENLS